MKFGSEFIIKIYKKKNSKARQHSLLVNTNNAINSGTSRRVKLKTVKTFCPKQNLTSMQEQFTLNNLEIKELDGELTKIEVEHHIVERERNILLGLNSPFICGYYKAQQDENHYYLFIEHIVGLTLD
jgi:serum/glucocorticoid-regulated kinase 2